MNENCKETLQGKLTDENYEKLIRLDNPKLHQFVADAIELCNPDSVFVCTDSADDIAYIRKLAVETGEEKQLATEGHTVHFDGYEDAEHHDQGRDKANTRYLLPPGVDLGKRLNTVDKAEGLAEIKGCLRGSMTGRQVLVRFFCLGPTGSEFSISGVQITDSAYVGHSEDLLYRSGYEQFKLLGSSTEFFRVLHSAGEVENNVSVATDKRRIYIDLEDEIVYSVNTQYGGNTIGFKKLSLRLAIRRADREGWLAEHMLIMGVHGPGSRVTYFAGAFPSFCGKTSTSMINGETIVGDDLAYLHRKAGRVHAVNVESGIFGVIENVNADDDPVIWNTITNPGEIIFSNILVTDGVPYWMGDGREHPERGINYSGEWHTGKTDKNGKTISPAHKNARYTVRLSDLSNLDEKAEDPEGVPVGGIIYGGRDSDTWVPVQQAFNWMHGVVTIGASLESETTAATLGAMGVRTFQPMSNLDFVSLPLGRYVQNHMDFVTALEHPPIIFAVNYFQKNSEGEYITGMNDKNVWVKWMELRVHGDVDAIRTPAGDIPLYEDLQKLFPAIIGAEYTREQYVEQFTLRIPESVSKIDRIEEIYRTEVADPPQVLFDLLAEQRERLEEAEKKHGPYVSPFDFAGGA
ncbi:MAG: phosphoenolpyruvate carboxykinase (GTP) [Planctomycetes bacterium]|nr:phosphoenolpyruvate carboxykinase (GTP) [Planctomycetota bacterium]